MVARWWVIYLSTVMIVMCLLPTMRQMKDVICRYGCRTHILVDRDYGEFKWFLVLLKWVHRPLRNGAKEMENIESYVQLAGVERKTMNWFGGHALANKTRTASFPYALTYVLTIGRSTGASAQTKQLWLCLPSYALSLFLCLHAYYVDYQLWSWRRQSNKRECML